MKIMILLYVERLICGNIPFSGQVEEVLETTEKQYPNKRNLEIQNKMSKSTDRLTFFHFWLG